jgi:hypothetical protein
MPRAAGLRRKSVADFRRTTHLDTGIPLMGCVSTLPQSADSAARTNVSEHTRAGRPPPDDAAGETTNREEKDDEAHVHTDRANARPIRSGAHPENHPMVTQLNEVFGEHTYFVNSDYLLSWNRPGAV